MVLVLGETIALTSMPVNGSAWAFRPWTLVAAFALEGLVLWLEITSSRALDIKLGRKP